MKKVVQLLAIGMLLLALIPGTAWASPGKPPAAREQLRELCAHPIWAKQVLDFEQGLDKDGDPVLPERSDPKLARHKPDGKFVSLGFGGTITLSFRRPVANNPGPNDVFILVQETTWLENYPLEAATVVLIADDKEYEVGDVTNEGTGLVMVTIPSDLDYVDAVRLEDVTPDNDEHQQYLNADGYDLDAVATCLNSAE